MNMGLKQADAGLRILCLSVIDLALRDMADNGFAGKEQTADALGFIMGGWCRALCETGGVDYDAVRNAARSMAARETTGTA
jgi:hypothetical protein